MQSILTGLTEGDFYRLAVLSNGIMTDILSLIGGGGGGAVTSANLPLSISNGVLTINLSGFSDTAAMNTAIGAAVAGYIPTTHEAWTV